MNFEECIVSILEGYDANHPVVVAWGKQLVGGEDLFVYKDLPLPHDQVWVVSRDRQPMEDTRLQNVRFAVNVRSFDYYKASTTAVAIAEDFNGRELTCGDVLVRVRANPVVATPVYVDGLGRIVFSSEFMCEVRS